MRYLAPMHRQWEELVNAACRRRELASTAAWALIALLNAPDGLYPFALAQAVGVAPPSFRATIDRFLEKGYAVEEHRPNRRRKTVMLTPRGVQEALEYLRIIQAETNALLGDPHSQAAQALTSALLGMRNDIWLRARQQAA